MVTTFKNSPSRDFHGWSNIYLLCAPVWINVLKDNRENERISIKKKNCLLSNWVNEGNAQHEECDPHFSVLVISYFHACVFWCHQMMSF